MRKTGFTLLELLVVALVIGILTAAAYPSLELAVWKARARRLLPVGRHAMESATVFYAQNGVFPTDRDMDLLDLSPAEKEKVHCALSTGPDEDVTAPGSCQIIGMQLETDDVHHVLFFFNALSDPSGETPIRRCTAACVARGKLPRKICKSLGGKSISEDPDTNIFEMFCLD